MYESIGIAEFEQLLKKAPLEVIDVREPDEFAAGHLKEAVHLPLSNLQHSFATLQKDRRYYIICHSGGRSAMACQFLAAQGLTVTNVMGGMSAWRGALVNGM